MLREDGARTLAGAQKAANSQFHCLSSSPHLCFSIFYTGRTIRIVGSYVWEGQPSKSNDAAEAEVGCVLNFQLSHACHPPVGESLSCFSVALFTIALVENDHFRGVTAKLFLAHPAREGRPQLGEEREDEEGGSLHAPTNYCQYQPKKLLLVFVFVFIFSCCICICICI